MRRAPHLVAALLLGAVGAGAAARAADRGALWRIVHGRCVPDQREHGAPAPCARVDLDRGEAAGTAVLKDRRGATQYLLIPTARIPGIESPALLASDAPNYFAAAWDAGTLVGDRLHRTLSRGDLALAVNSRFDRSQDQLHVHVDCVRLDVRAALDRAEAGIDGQWHPLPVPLAGHRYRALRLPGPLLGDADPFRLLARSLPGPTRDMAGHTLVLVGDTHDGQADFILLDGQASTLAWLLAPFVVIGSGSGEELEDHDCRIARQEPG